MPIRLPGQRFIFLIFREDIKALLRRVAKIRFPGGEVSRINHRERALARLWFFKAFFDGGGEEALKMSTQWQKMCLASLQGFFPKIFPIEIDKLCTNAPLASELHKTA